MLSQVFILSTRKAAERPCVANPPPALLLTPGTYVHEEKGVSVPYARAASSAPSACASGPFPAVSTSSVGSHWIAAVLTPAEPRPTLMRRRMRRYVQGSDIPG
eukprot:scaffold79422_cov34-Tisochrysis_lutea.AAC.2